MFFTGPGRFSGAESSQDMCSAAITVQMAAAVLKSANWLSQLVFFVTKWFFSWSFKRRKNCKMVTSNVMEISTLILSTTIEHYK